MHSSSPVHLLIYFCWIADEPRNSYQRSGPQIILLNQIYSATYTLKTAQGEFDICCASFMSKTALWFREYSADDRENGSELLPSLRESNKMPWCSCHNCYYDTVGKCNSYLYLEGNCREFTLI